MRDLSASPGSSRSTQYQPIYNKSYAIVVGIDIYKDPKLRTLGNAEADARSIQDVLSSEPYNFQVDVLLGKEATRRAITQALNRIRQVSEINDRVIFYFAGHGYVVQNNRGFDIGYLACADTNPDDPFDGLKFDEVISLSQFARAKHIAFILDACFSGQALGLTRSAVQTTSEQEYLLHNAYQILTAGGFEVVSDARSMTGELVKALREGIPGENTILTFSHLGQHIHDVIHQMSDGYQSPIFGYLEGSSKGQMILITPGRLGQLPTDLRMGLSNKDPMMRRFAIAEAETYLADPDLGEKVRSVLEEMQYDDEDRDVRRRAGEALRVGTESVEFMPVAEEAPQDFKTFENEISPHETREIEGTSSFPVDLILEILPPPFEWCNIPAGEVTLADKAGTFEVMPFRMAKYPITYEQYQVFLEASDGFKDDRWWQGLTERELEPVDQTWRIARRPRENVSWYDAVAFCHWLSDRTGYEVRLPTEWEWQWAAQGPTRLRYPWGDKYIQGYANIDEITGGIKKGVYLGRTTLVDQYPQGVSPWGVFDMAGNVFEWCLNEAHQTGNTDLSGNAPRSVRGGSWDSSQNLIRCSYRNWESPTNYGDVCGFRVIHPLKSRARKTT